MLGLKPVEIEALEPGLTRLIGPGATTAGCAAPSQSNKVSKFFPSLFDAYVIRSKAVEQNHRVVVFLLFFSNIGSFGRDEQNKTIRNNESTS